MRFKLLIKTLLRSTGFEIRRLRSGGQTADLFHVQKRLVGSRAEATVFDIGAHYGETAVRYLSLLPHATIYCFEPSPDSFSKLQTSLSPYKNIRPYCVGLADSPGKRSFYVSEMSATNSLLPRPANGRRYYPQRAGAIRQVEVDTTTLDRFCEEMSVSTIDILKMDVQGAELLVLQGADRLLSTGRIRVICTEVMFVPHYDQAPLFHDVWRWLDRYGYSLYDLSLAAHGTNGQLRFGDAVFISSRTRAEVVDAFKDEP